MVELSADLAVDTSASNALYSFVLIRSKLIKENIDALLLQYRL